MNQDQKFRFKPKPGWVYVVTNECLRLVEAKGVFKGKMVKAIKIGNAKDFTNRLGSLNTAVYENFDFHLGIKTDDVVGLEGINKVVQAANHALGFRLKDIIPLDMSGVADDIRKQAYGE